MSIMSETFLADRLDSDKVLKILKEAKLYPALEKDILIELDKECFYTSKNGGLMSWMSGTHRKIQKRIKELS